eukprot:763713-Hanusia_phi.AAC.1
MGKEGVITGAHWTQPGLSRRVFRSKEGGGRNRSPRVKGKDCPRVTGVLSGGSAGGGVELKWGWGPSQEVVFDARVHMRAAREMGREEGREEAGKEKIPVGASQKAGCSNVVQQKGAS